MKLRFAIWCAVSSRSQAGAEKDSLPVQLKACRAAGDSRGWHHVQDFTVPGQTRTQWVSLYHAEKNMPQLHAMLEAASRHEFDVLILYDLNRFRSLMQQVFDVLSDLNIQLYILSNPREPVDPDHYTEERKREVAMTVGLNSIISDNEIASLRRHFREKMPERITRHGLHPGLGIPPYGYQKPLEARFERKVVLVQVPEQIRVLKQIKDLFFTGLSTREIAKRLNEQGVLSSRGKRWGRSMVAYVLQNPYYAGIVTFGAVQRIRNRREGTFTRRKGNVVTGKGKHQPVWDIATHRRIKAEFERRGKGYPGRHVRQLSSLLRCFCGRTLWAQDTKDGVFWRCSIWSRGHVYIKDERVLDQVAKEAVRILSDIPGVQIPTPEDNRATLQAERRELLAKQKRWMDLYEEGTMSKEAIQERVAAINARIKHTDELLAQSEETLSRASSRRDELTQFASAIDSLPDYIKRAPAAQVNADLRRLFSHATVSQDKKVELKLASV